MATPPHDGHTHDVDRGARDRSVGEHIFIWVAWALAAAFWGASLTTMVEIFRAAGQPGPEVSAPGVPGGSAYLVLVVVAFLVMAFALAWAEIRAAGAGRRGEAATAALYSSIERQGGEDPTARSPEGRPINREFR